MAQGAHREFALLKTDDDVVTGERFWIIKLDRIRGVLARTEVPVDADTAEAHLVALGCDASETAQLLADARHAFEELLRPPPINNMRPVT